MNAQSDYGDDPLGYNAEGKTRTVYSSEADNEKPHDEGGTHLPPEMLPLPAELLPVQAFSEDLLPEAFRDWITDISERMQAPPDFAAVAAVVTAGSLLGNKVAIQPKVFDDWREHPNLWGLCVGRPSMMKSPAILSALRPFESVCAAAMEGHAEKTRRHAAEVEAAKMRVDAMRKALKKRIEKGEDVDPSEFLIDEEVPPPGLRRPKINDATIEALHAILTQNPNGSLLYQDEIAGLFARLRDPERGRELCPFLLSAWGGNSPFTSDRIGRGLNLHVPRCCLSLFGGTQPGKIAPLVNSAMREDVNDDGFLQRFSLIVWPDNPGQWRHIDREPNLQAYARACAVFERLEAVRGGDEEPYVYAFTPEAAGWFADAFLKPLHKRLRSDELPPALESHLSKYRKLVPGLALIFELIAEPDPPAVSLDSLNLALRWADYLESHACRLYGSGERSQTQAAKLIIKKLGAVPRLEDKEKRWGQHPFAAWQVIRPKWSGLTDKATVEAAIRLLVDKGWLIEVIERTGGKPAALLYPNPGITQKNSEGA